MKKGGNRLRKSEVKIVASIDEVRLQLANWRAALIENAEEIKTGKWHSAEGRFYVKGDLDITLSKNARFNPSIVHINLPNRPETVNGLTGIAESDDGKVWLLRQGRLQKNELSDAIQDEEFSAIAKLKPVLISNPRKNSPQRYWFKVCRLDQATKRVRRETADFVDLCETVRLIKNCRENETADEEVARQEGGKRWISHQIHERCRSLVEKKKEQAFRKFGELRCEACKFRFSEMYGQRGDGIIEVHHNKKPLHKYDGFETTNINDLALICANCHRIAHATKDWMTVEQVTRLIDIQS